jgi:hypothetical protein
VTFLNKIACKFMCNLATAQAQRDNTKSVSNSQNNGVFSAGMAHYGKDLGLAAVKKVALG